MRTLILRLTHRLWNREISRVLCRSYSDGLIDSEQLHALTSMFDPTQPHRVYGRSRNRSCAMPVRVERALNGSEPA